MEPDDNGQCASDGQLAGTNGRLAGDLVHLQKLWIGLTRTSVVIQRATAAYLESRSLLERIDGAPDALVVSEICVPD
jgi:hypothetical protein